ncbi:sporulation protein YabP [Caminicella sporogenes DSM 14501]|uniref:Sporulation protein YabP n=1 Tax=Caminicella sporogenes DSM 14501 TaxID=1121266 RepID=A0A1M6QSM2_9FIRM|nr:sporulation protein YabP [Caminicella sporogenes]RKD20923.1 sporulation protein YabP [Caminicella sporogenes]WIF95669.1 sporulation protein YabP [Caminicella sporogenes]SHK23319.1 sporulation protein YabP [Caminicella sporogenes DSM 14501]
MEEKNGFKNRSQNIILENREKMSISGVEHVKSYNDDMIVLVTVQGNLTIRGEGLDIKKLNLEDGNLSIEGYITSIVYSEKEDNLSKGLGFLGKMFK